MARNDADLGTAKHRSSREILARRRAAQPAGKPWATFHSRAFFGLSIAA
jgi:hypothetical protein